MFQHMETQNITTIKTRVVCSQKFYLWRHKIVIEDVKTALKGYKIRQISWWGLLKGRRGKRNRGGMVRLATGWGGTGNGEVGSGLQGWGEKYGKACYRNGKQGRRNGGTCYTAGEENGTGQEWWGLLQGWEVETEQGRYDGAWWGHKGGGGTGNREGMGGFATRTKKREGGMVGLITKLGRGTRNRGGMVGMLQRRERGTGNGGHNEESFIPAPHEPDPDATSDNIPTPQTRRFPCLLIPR